MLLLELLLAVLLERRFEVLRLEVLLGGAVGWGLLALLLRDAVDDGVYGLECAGHLVNMVVIVEAEAKLTGHGPAGQDPIVGGQGPHLLEIMSCNIFVEGEGWSGREGPGF